MHSDSCEDQKLFFYPQTKITYKEKKKPTTYLLGLIGLRGETSLWIFTMYFIYTQLEILNPKQKNFTFALNLL